MQPCDSRTELPILRRLLDEDFRAASCSVGLAKGEHEFKLNFPLLWVITPRPAGEQTAFCLQCTFEIAVQSLSLGFLFYLILPMTDCTLFKPKITFPLCELLHYQILIEAELPATP